MKDAFENNLKQSLENFEMPYDSAAWPAMQSRMDTTASTPSLVDKMKEGLNANEYPYNPAAWSAMSKRLEKGAKGGFKWYYAAAIIGAAAVTTVLFWNTGSDEKTAKNETSQVEQNQMIANPSKSNNTNSNSNTTTNTVVDNNGNVVAPNEVNTHSGQNANSNTNGVTNTSASNQNTTQQGSSQQSSNNSGTNQSITSNSGATTNGNNSGTSVGTNPLAVPAWKFISPAIPETVCEGSTIQIQNENDYPIVITYPNGLNWVGRENQITNLNPSVAGTYKVGYLRNSRFKEKTTFVVHELPTADMDFVDLSQKYLNGLPTIEVRSTSSAASYLWEYENGKVRGISAGLHFYDAGLHLVRLTATNDNGCSATVEKPVNVTEDYNLMAMNAFYPTGNDRTTNTFMPYALTERENVTFQLIIVDPNDGHTLFETSDFSEGWNGIDQQSGSLVSLEKSYIWKVTIMNPEKGEDNVYAGTVLTLPQ